MRMTMLATAVCLMATCFQGPPPSTSAPPTSTSAPPIAGGAAPAGPTGTRPPASMESLATVPSTPAPPLGTNPHSTFSPPPAVPPFQRMSRWTTRAIDKVIIPAQEAGLLVNLDTDVTDAQGRLGRERVTRGFYVQKDQVLGQIDDRLAAADLKAAGYKLDVAKLEAGNRINVDYATMACRVAQVIYLHDLETNKAVPGAVPLHEVMQHELEYKKLQLQIQQAEHELTIAQASVAVREAELDKAQVLLQRMKIKSPCEGLVINVFRHPGEWVQPGERVLEILRLDKLYVDGQQNLADRTPSDVVNKKVVVTTPALRRPDGSPLPFPGRVVFASPEIMQGGDYAVEIEVENQRDGRGNWLLLPGMEVNVMFQ